MPATVSLERHDEHAHGLSRVKVMDSKSPATLAGFF